jgi:O-antigen ligase
VIYKIFILSLFFDFGVYYFYLSTLLFPIVFISFLINFSIKYSEIENPILSYLLFFLLSIIPSYLAAISHPESYLISYNLIAFVSIIFITPIIIKKTEYIKSISIIYLLGCTLNAIYLIIYALLSGKRAFGFAGIMYVDLVGIGIIVAFSGLLFYKKFRFVLGIITVLLILALLFTQTRNSWISTGLVLLLLTLYYIIKRKYYEKFNLYNFKNIIPAIASIILFIVIVGILYPNTFNRVTEEKNQTTEQLAETMDFGSIATRFFIWKTAFAVFEDNLIIGTGFHSFRFVSNEYNTLEPFLYSTFVYNLTPHTTILALLADTGIIGFLGFLIFMYLVLKFFKKNLDQSITQNQKIISFVLFWCQIYITFSMIMTDAWLWGPLHMLWAIILGVSVFLWIDIKKTKNLYLSSRI